MFLMVLTDFQPSEDTTQGHFNVREGEQIEIYMLSSQKMTDFLGIHYIRAPLMQSYKLIPANQVLL